MFKKSITSYLAICAISLVVPQIASAGQGGVHYSHHGGGYHNNSNFHYLGGHMHHSSHKHSNRAPVTTSSGSDVTTHTGTHVTTKWAKGYDHGCGCGETKPAMSQPYYVFFANDSSAISAAGHAEIERAYHDAMHHSTKQFKLSGHASTPGDATYNMKLSARRAAAVTKDLVSMGVPEHNIMTAAFGETVPYDRATGHNNAAKDRRVELRYVYSE